ncbi:MAG: hypothetical protein MR902_04000 [Campylobacter sp.]|nr:hypothetical protein [Campylobacter sp.]
MFYVETAVAAIIFKCNKNTLQQSANRNSKKYPFVKTNTNERSRGGVRLLFSVRIDELKKALQSGLVDKNTRVWNESLIEISLKDLGEMEVSPNVLNQDKNISKAEIKTQNLNNIEVSSKNANNKELKTDNEDYRIDNKNQILESKKLITNTHLNLEPLSLDKKALNLDDMADKEKLKDEKNSSFNHNFIKKELKDEKNSTKSSSFNPISTQGDTLVYGGFIDDAGCNSYSFKQCNTRTKIQTQKIKELEKMNKIKAVNEMSCVPKGFSKTAWGKSVASKYGISLKTLYAWRKDIDDELCECEKSVCDAVHGSELSRDMLNGKSSGNSKNICPKCLKPYKTKKSNIGIDFKATFKTSSFDINALEWALAAWLNNPLASKIFIYETTKKEALKNGWKVGSYKSFARLFDKPEIKALLIRATAGERGVRNEIAPFVLRDLNLYKSMEMICGDQIVFDFDTINEYGEVINPNAYVWIDMGSGAIIGVDVVLGKYNKLSVGRSLKMALGFGVPDSIYTDNGKPELSNYVKEVISQLSGIKLKDFEALDPRLTHKKARPANSRAKPIENIFNHVQRWMMESIIYEKGGASYHKDNRKNSEILKKYMKNNPLNYKEFIDFFAKAIKKWNEHLNKSRNIVPMDKFISELEQVSAFDKTTLDYIFSERRAIKVRNSSINLTINKAKYSFVSPFLSKYNGQVVEVRLIDDELKSVSVVDIDKHTFICEAYINEVIDPRDHALVKAKISENEKVVKAVNEAFSYYKGLYSKTIRINTYTSVAIQTKVKNEKNKKLKKKFAMSNEKLLEAM